MKFLPVSGTYSDGSRSSSWNDSELSLARFMLVLAPSASFCLKFHAAISRRTFAQPSTCSRCCCSRACNAE